MDDKMTAVLATFSGFKLVQGRKVAQLVLEVPVEHADAALQALGGIPKPDAPQWVGVAPVDPSAAEKPAERPKGGKLAQRAGILCGEAAFMRFVQEKYDPDVRKPEHVAEWLREYCGVISRSELDHCTSAAVNFSIIQDAYRDWLRT